MTATVVIICKYNNKCQFNKQLPSKWDRSRGNQRCLCFCYKTLSSPRECERNGTFATLHILYTVLDNKQVKQDKQTKIRQSCAMTITARRQCFWQFWQFREEKKSSFSFGRVSLHHFFFATVHNRLLILCVPPPPFRCDRIRYRYFTIRYDAI